MDGANHPTDQKPSKKRNVRKQSPPPLDEQLNLLKAVRALEEKLATAKANLHKSMEKEHIAGSELSNTTLETDTQPVRLTKDDYLSLVDLYFYSHHSRFAPDSPDESPTPLFLEDYSFKLSEDLAKPDTTYLFEEDKDYESPLKHVEKMLKSRQLREISVMQAFIDLLLDDNSSNRALFDTYKRLPDPGVAHLPTGIIRLFLQRMSTPWTKSEKSMLRYLSLIDDMQRAGLPINTAEWSSAIYLAGRSFARVTESDVAAAFRIWREMEHEAGVKAQNVTFNILFDIAVRAGKYVLGESILKEMHERGLRLNRLGRVSLIYYHGLRGDGDGVRKAYRDFVEAGEIVDTLVLNCVMASLINAQEPVAADQIYARMKNLQTRLRKGQGEDGSQTLFMKYPPPDSMQLNQEMASNSLGRILAKSARLKEWLPEQHALLQNSMPLTPDYVTYRTLVSYHATVSGDLDKLTVLLNDMTELFDLPFQSIFYQLLFKGFSTHGGSKEPDAQWSLRRLDLVWDACRNAIKDAAKAKRKPDDPIKPEPTLPSITEVNTTTEPRVEPQTIQHGPTRKKLSPWDEFVLDLAAFPRERRKPIERVHAQLFDEDAQQSSNPSSFHNHNPFFHAQQSTTYISPEPTLDHEEGEYVLPSPTVSTHANAPPEALLGHGSADASAEDPAAEEASSRDVRATRPLVCWLLRAYTRCSGERRQVEEVWNSVRKVWRPFDQAEIDSVRRVLRRCLRDCDKTRGMGI